MDKSEMKVNNVQWALEPTNWKKYPNFISMQRQAKWKKNVYICAAADYFYRRRYTMIKPIIF